MTKSLDFPMRGHITIFYEEPNQCPRCKHSIKPVELFSYPYRSDRGISRYAVMYLCQNCYDVFIVLSEKAGQINGYDDFKPLYCGPSLFAEKSFDKPITTLSPLFVKIFNQAAAAESNGLDEIAGIGYRKALEFLVKDFCIHNYPDKEDEIKKSLLSKCISEYIEYPKIKTLSEKASWIGNDETHYVRKHEDRDIRDMKQFIEAIVHFVTMDLTVEDAASIQHP